MIISLSVRAASLLVACGGLLLTVQIAASAGIDDWERSPEALAYEKKEAAHEAELIRINGSEPARS